MQRSFRRRKDCFFQALEPRNHFAAITVSTTADAVDGTTSSIGALLAASGGAGISLREAIIAANNTPGSDTVTIPAGTYILTRTGADDLASLGDLDVRDAIVLNGAATSTTIIQAGTNNTNGIDKIFSFNPLGSLTGFSVSISNMTLQYGRNSQSFASGNGMGGAMDFDAGTTGSGSLIMTNVTCTQNSTAEGDGGAVALFQGGLVTFNGCTFSNNTVHYTGSAGTAGVTGGGLFIGSSANGSVTLTNTTISNNRVNYLIGSTVSGNGGGIYSFGTMPLIIHNSTIANNDAGVDGGGVMAPNVTIDQGSIIRDNHTGRWGGGVFSSGTSTISNSTIYSNFAAGSGGQGGGGIFANAGTLTVSNSRIVLNVATVGAANADRNTAGGGTIAATNNWWGSNASPAPLVAGAGVTFNPWLVLSASASTTNVTAGSGATSAIAGSITKNSNGTAGFSVPNGTQIGYASALGLISPASTTLTSGSSTATWTVGSAGGVESASATVDSQTGSVNINIAPAQLPPPDLQSGSDTGFSTTDNITNLTSLVFDVTGAEAAATVELLRDGVVVGSRTGNGSISLASAATGVHAYTVRQTVDAIVGTPSSALSVNVDQTPPATPVAPDLQAASDTGVSTIDKITKDNTPTFDITSTDTYYRVYRSGTPISNSYENAASFTALATLDGSYSFYIFAVDTAGNTSIPGALLNVKIDTVAPTASTPQFLVDGTAPAIKTVFSEDVGATIGTSDLVVQNVPPAGPIPITASYVGAENAAYASLSTNLSSNNYTFQAVASGITDVAGNSLTSNANLSFFFLSGDANRDRKVNTLDFNILAANFGGSSKVFSQGDFDYSGIVDSTDFTKIVSQFGKSLPAPAAVMGASIFSSTGGLALDQIEI